MSSGSTTVKMAEIDQIINEALVLFSDEMDTVLTSNYVPGEVEGSEGPCPSPLHAPPPEQLQQPQQQQQQILEQLQYGQPLQISITKGNFQPIGDVVGLEVDKDYTFTIQNLNENEPFLVILRRIEQFSDVTIKSDKKRIGEDDGCEVWPFTMRITCGDVTPEIVKIPGDTSHYGYSVCFGGSNEAIININKISSLLTTEERRKISKPKGGKNWALQFLNPENLSVRGSIRIQVFAIVRKNQEKPNCNKRKQLESNDEIVGKKIKTEIENGSSENLSVDYTFLSVFAINVDVSIPIGILELHGPFISTDIREKILEQRPYIKQQSIKMVAETNCFIEECLELPDEDWFFSVQTLNELGQAIYKGDRGAPLSVFDHPELVQHLVDNEGRHFHVVEVRVIIQRMMKDYRQKLALQ